MLFEPSAKLTCFPFGNRNANKHDASGRVLAVPSVLGEFREGSAEELGTEESPDSGRQPPLE